MLRGRLENILVDHPRTPGASRLTRAVFTHPERILLERATPQKRKNAPRDLAFYMIALARLGGYLDRNSDPPPGTTGIWRRFTRLADLDEGFRAAQTGQKLLVGN